jgi:uncharacterized repeat protein (TIGR02543 family)
MFRKSMSGVSLLTAVSLSLSGLVFSPAHADVPVLANGSYVCTTGQLRAGGDTSPAYTITNGALSNGNGCAGDVLIPEGVTSIGVQAFSQSSAITSVTIPASVTSIGNLAFYMASSLNTVTFAQGSQLTSMGNRVFDGASALTSITVPASVTSIGSSFRNTAALHTVTFAQGSQLTSIGEAAFERATALTSITIPAGVTSIGDYAFYRTALTSITIPSSVTNLGEGAFNSAGSLKDVNFLGNAPTSIGADAFGYIGSDAKAHIRVNASGFGAPSSTWNGLLVQADLYEVTYSAGSGSVVSSALFLSGDLIQTAPVSTRAGYTLSGWSTSANGNVITFPYTVTSDITLHAIWKSTNTTPKSATKSATTSYSAVFSAGSSVVTQTSKTAIKKMVSKSGKDAKFTITGIATKSTGVPDSRVKGLAKARAEKVSAYLIKLGVKKSNITIKVKIVASGITPKTDILAKYLTK